MPKSEYIPGVCNIGPAEIAARRNGGWTGVMVTAVVWFALRRAGAEPVAYWVIVLPAALAATCFLQAAWHFCANFGLRGVFNFGPQLGHTETAAQAEFRAKDRRRALQIIGLSLLIGMAVAAAFVLTA